MNNWYLAGIAAVLWVGAYFYYFRNWMNPDMRRRDMKRLRKGVGILFKR